MKANLLYKLGVILPSAAAFVASRAAATIVSSIEAQNPWASNYWFGANGSLFPSSDFTTETVSVIGNQCPNLVLSPLTFYIRSNPESNWSVSYAGVHTLGVSAESYQEYVSRCHQIIASIHMALASWTLLPRLDLNVNLIGHTRDILMGAIIPYERRPGFLAALAECPSYDKDSDSRPMSPRFEPDVCTDLSMAGNVNTIFWV